MSIQVPLFDLPEVAERHPARYSEELYPHMARFLKGTKSVLDPFAGVGGIFRLREYGYTGQIFAIELQERWARWHPETEVGNALDTLFQNECLDAICTSPTFGNRMADTYTDDSHRNTYTAAHGKPLHPDNSGVLQWGPKYKIFHRKWIAEANRILKMNGTLVLDMKDHFRDGEWQKVSDWWMVAMEDGGFALRTLIQVECSGNRQGENGELRIPHHNLMKFEKVGE